MKNHFGGYSAEEIFWRLRFNPFYKLENNQVYELEKITSHNKFAVIKQGGYYYFNINSYHSNLEAPITDKEKYRSAMNEFYSLAKGDYLTGAKVSEFMITLYNNKSDHRVVLSLNFEKMVRELRVKNLYFTLEEQGCFELIDLDLHCLSLLQLSDFIHSDIDFLPDHLKNLTKYQAADKGVKAIKKVFPDADEFYFYQSGVIGFYNGEKCYKFNVFSLDLFDDFVSENTLLKEPKIDF